jgi:hypothetical protein
VLCPSCPKYRSSTRALVSSRPPSSHSTVSTWLGRQWQTIQVRTTTWAVTKHRSDPAPAEHNLMSSVVYAL